MIEDGTILDCGHAKDGLVGYSKLGSLGGKTMCEPCNESRKYDDYKPELLRTERRKLGECIGSSTLVGVMGFATVNGSCPKCGYDHVNNKTRATLWGDGIRAECAVDDCGGKLPIRDPFPIRHGNCCNILNMCSENAQHVVKTMPEVATDCEVEVVMLKKRERIRVVDERIPKGYLRHVCSGCGVFEP